MEKYAAVSRQVMDVLRRFTDAVEPVSIVGAGDVLLARWIVAQNEGLSAEESLRLAVAAGSSSVLEVGAGRFDPKEAARLVPLVEVDELQPVRS